MLQIDPSTAENSLEDEALQQAKFFEDCKFISCESQQYIHKILTLNRFRDHWISIDQGNDYG